jgi:DNA-directed RNA polymerase
MVLEEDKAKGREFEGTVGQTMVRRLVTGMEENVARIQALGRKKVIQSTTTGTRLSGWELPIQTLSVPELAYITVKTVLTQDPDKADITTLGKRVGSFVNLQLRWHELKKGEKEAAQAEDRGNRLNYLRREVKQLNPKSLRKWLKKLDDVETTTWDYETHVKVGVELVQALVAAAEGILEEKMVHKIFGHRRTKHVMVVLTAEARASLEASYAEYAEEHPWLEPMLIQPLDWQRQDGAYVGGYVNFPAPLLKVSADPHTHTAIEDVPVPQAVLDAVNRIQRTAWAVNEPVFRLAEEAHERQLAEVLPVEPLRDMPEPVPDDEWAAMTPAERGRMKNERRQVHDHNNRLDAKRWAMRRQLLMAQSLLDEGRFYYPHNLDFRGRMYPIPQDLHPQADDWGRAMLTFAEPKPLGPDGLQWLVFHLANCYGMDKASRGEQMDWYNDHNQEVYLVATDPFGEGLEFWLGADEKHRWQFLAAAIEVCAAWAHPVSPEFYMSHLPVHVDGSCNGLQHLSAMGRDPIGAHATNLTGDPERQDIYQIVADKVNKAVTADTLLFDYANHPHLAPAHAWYGKVTRNTVKRGVMTMPYGLTPIGMRDQLIDDRWTTDLEGDDYKNAGYLRDLMLTAIEDTVQAAAETMAWMQDNATILAKNGKHVEWYTPIGLMVRQRYVVPPPKTIQTVIGVGKIRRLRVTLDPMGDDTTLRVSKQASSIAPNIIHSFDAAHMQMSVNAAAEGLSFSVIHDSFGVHACDMPEFLGCIKREFVEIYSSDWFWMLQQDFEASRGTEEFPLIDQPTPGAWEPGEVMHSDFFFA